MFHQYLVKYIIATQHYAEARETYPGRFSSPLVVDVKATGIVPFVPAIGDELAIGGTFWEVVGRQVFLYQNRTVIEVYLGP